MRLAKLNADLYQKITEAEEPHEEVENTDENVADVEENSTQEVDDSYNQQTPPKGSSQTIEERWEELAQQLITDVNNIGRISPDCGQ